MSSGTALIITLIIGWIVGMFTAAGIVRGGTQVPTPRKNTRDGSPECDIFPCFDAAEHDDWMCRRCERGTS